MTSPGTSTKLLLLADPRSEPPDPGGVPVRRYRLAKVQFESRDADPAARYEHLKRVYD
jgi:hypothetical protein